MKFSLFIMLAIFLGFFLSALALSIIFTNFSRRLAIRLKIFDKPDKRKLHLEPVPYLGGLGMFAAFVVYGLVTRWLVPEAYPDWFAAGIVGGGLLVAAGVYDDARGLSAWIKFPIQIAAALILYYFTDLSVTTVGHLFGGWIEFGPLAVFSTILWTVILINAINLIDGLDGLAAGVVGISSFFLFIIEVLKGNPANGLLSLGLSGVCFGFLRLNFSPARIFMGDAGSMFLGFILAAFSMNQTVKGTTVVTLLFPVLVFGIPILDTTMAFFRRLSEGKHPFQGDARHIHHRFLALGLSDRQVVLVIYFFCIALSLFALVMTRLTPSYRLLTLGLLVLLVSFVIVAMQYLERQFAATLEEVKAYKEWLRYGAGEGAGPGMAECRMADRPAPERVDDGRRTYQPPEVSPTLLDKLTRAEEQRTERVLVLADGEWGGRIGEILKSLGHNMLVVENIEAAGDDITGGRTGVIIIDEQRFGAETSDLVVRIRLMNPTATVLVLSGASESARTLGLLRLGAYDILPACAPDEVIEVMIFHAMESRYLTRRLRFLQLVFWLMVFSIPVWVIIGRFVTMGAFY